MTPFAKALLFGLFLLTFLIPPRAGLAQKCHLDIAIESGVVVPNGQFRKLNLLKAGPYAGIGVDVSYPIGSRFGLLFSIVPTISSATKNNFRMASDCLSEPCVTYLTTQDSVRGRDMRFWDIAVSAGGSFSFAKTWKVKLSAGFSWNPVAWVESGGFVEDVPKYRFIKYKPDPSVTYKRTTGILRLSLVKYLQVHEKDRLFLELASQIGMSPKMRIPGQKMWKGDFQFRPSLIGIGFGIQL
ncbi:MAG: hypothetical protein IPN95_30430 [Bacteroidetes bacterium]|nr:hypothetical protein [Bacteroidota bacterium]